MRAGRLDFIAFEIHLSSLPVHRLPLAIRLAPVRGPLLETLDVLIMLLKRSRKYVRAVVLRYEVEVFGRRRIESRPDGLGSRIGDGTRRQSRDQVGVVGARGC